MFRTPTFTTGDFARRAVFLPDREYGLALDALVKGCADVLVTRSDGSSLEILLGRRRVHPQPDWWFVGGRTRPGETPEEGAARNVRRELKLEVAASRFRVVGNYSFVWRFRAQPPAENGTADISTVLELRLSSAEAAAINFDDSFAKSEYRDARWTTPREVLEGEYNPALQQAVRDLLARHAFDDLCAAVALHPAVVVAARARRLVAWHRAGASSSSETPVKTVYDEAAEVYEFRDPTTNAALPRPAAPLPAEARADLLPSKGSCFGRPRTSSLLGSLVAAASTVVNYLAVSPRLLLDALAGPLIGAGVGIALYRRLSQH